jgi:superfamily II DNA or RNA helicase/DNA-binding transcriptional regulator YiaG
MNEKAISERDKFQADAVTKVLNCYRNDIERCQGFAPTGAGKTHIAAAVWDGLDHAEILVFVSPTRTVSQAEAKFKHLSRQPGARSLQVNCNPGATRVIDEIRSFLADSSTPRLVFVTDTSLPLVTAALNRLGLLADLFVIDEAHRNTSVRPVGVKAVWAEEAVKALPAARRLYMTATPRTWTSDDDAEPVTVFSQDDEELFGPVAFELSFDEAVRRGIVLPVNVYALESGDGNVIRAFTDDPRLERIWEGERQEYREIAAHLAIYRAVTDGLPGGDSEDRYRPSRIMVSFNHVSEARGFAERHAKIMRALGAGNAMAFAFVGATPQREREQIKRAVEDLSYGSRQLDHAVIAQCGALTESFDLPDLDLTVLVTPKNSTLAVQQLVGRVTRLPVRSSKRWASVVTTDLNPDPDSVVFTVVRAMMAMSDALRHDLYLPDGPPEEPNKGVTPVHIGTLDGKPLPENFADTMSLSMVPVRKMGAWLPEFVQRIRDYKAESGDANPSHEYVTADGYPLGARASYLRHKLQRSNHVALRVAFAAVEKELTELGFISQSMHVMGGWIPEFVRRIEQYRAEYGDASPPVKYVTSDGYPLGRRTDKARSYYRKLDRQRGERGNMAYRKVFEETKSKLDALGFRWITEPKAVLDESTVRECRQRFAAGERIKDLASEKGIGAGALGSAVRGDSWKHVPMPEAMPARMPHLTIPDNLRCDAENRAVAFTDAEIEVMVREKLTTGEARRIREAAGWRVSDVADWCGVSAAMPSAWEHGRNVPNPATARAYLTWVFAAEVVVAYSGEGNDET